MSNKKCVILVLLNVKLNYLNSHVSILVYIICFSSISSAQLLSHFSWDTDPVTQADFGPNGTIKPGSPAISSPATYNGTNGLNPREVTSAGPTVGVDLDLDASDGYFDVKGIDVSIAFQREEGIGDFVTRGNDFVMGMSSGNFYVEFSLISGGGSTKIVSGNIFSIPDDDVFRLYRFVYNHNTGIGEASVDGAIVWTHNGTPGQEMYWSANTLRIGDLMDANGADVAIFDEFRLYGIPDEVPLPVEWLDFSCGESIHGVELNWSTATETNNSHFEVEYTIDGDSYVVISEEISGAGNSAFQNQYTFIDTKPKGSINYYRIKQVDFDGAYDYSEIISCKFSQNTELVQVYPNPSKNSMSITVNTATSLDIVDITGKIILSNVFLEKDTEMRIDVSRFPRGIYLLKTDQSIEKIIVQ